jgi:hypothetical protein
MSCVVSKDEQAKCRTLNTKKHILMQQKHSKRQNTKNLAGVGGGHGCFSCVCVVVVFVVAGRSVCDGLITRLGGALPNVRVSYVTVCDQMQHNPLHEQRDMYKRSNYKNTRY